MNMCLLDKSLRAFYMGCEKLLQYCSHSLWKQFFSKLLLHDSTLNINLIAYDTVFSHILCLCCSLFQFESYLKLIIEYICMSACMFSRVWLFATPGAYQAPLSLGFPRQEYLSELPFPTPGNLPDPGIKHTSPASPALAGGFFTTVPPGKPKYIYIMLTNLNKKQLSLVKQ